MIVRPPDLHLRLTPWQAETLAWEEEFGLIVGGRGAAKTRDAAVLALIWLCQYPGVPFAVCADDFQKLKTNFMQEFDLLLREEGWIHGREYAFNKAEKKYTTAWGSALQGFTMDKPAERTKGPTVGGVIFDEADQISEEHFEIFQVCARDPRGPRQRRLFANGTPPTHYLNRLFDPTSRERRPGYRIRRVSSYENTFLPASELRQMERQYPPGTLQYRRWVLGEAVAMAGALWPEFDLAKHVVPRSALPTAYLGANGLDLGHRPDPYAFVVARVDAQNRIWIHKEHQQAELSALQQAPILKQLYEAGDVFSDHDASERATLSELGIHTTLAQKSIPSGVEAVRQAIIEGRLFVTEDCPLTIAAMQNSTWAPNPTGGREKPKHDQYSHLASAVRYMVVGVHGLATGMAQERRRKPLY